MKKQVSELTSQQYWGGLNRRCDNRIAILSRLGYQWNKETRSFNYRLRPFNQTSFNMGFLTHADKRSFLDILTQGNYSH
jgi:hypothetical protein